MDEKKAGLCTREYIGGDCYGYTIHCDTCGDNIRGFSEYEANAKWEEHKCIIPDNIVEDG